jgi:DNA-binding LacI/PurR family transcriptional regulator
MYHVTIKDIARKLNVAVSTVSRAFNDKYDIKKDTRDLILKTAAEMGYRPNPIAKKLIQRRTYNVGVIVPEFINSFFPEVILGIQKVLLEKKYQVLITSSNENPETEKENIKTMEDNMVDGIIISLSTETSNSNYLSKMVKEGFPMVMFNRVNEEIPISKVVFDDYKWAFFATEHLIEQGYKKIYHFSGPHHLCLSKNRINGFRDAMNKHKLPFTGEQIIETGLFIEDGERVMESLLNKGTIPEAIFSFNDPTAIGAMKMLKKYKLKIPDDVAVVGFSETKLASLIEPALTSVIQPTFEMGMKVAHLLLKQIENDGHAEVETIVLNGKINIRESSVKSK